VTAPATKLPIVNAFVDDDGRHIQLFELHPDGVVRRRRERATYATYHRRSDISLQTLRALKSSAHVAHVAYEGNGREWVRVGWADESLRRIARHKFRDMGIGCYEGDVDPVMWWLVHHDAAIAKPRRCYLDIETDSRVSLTRKQDMRVLTWAMTAHDTGVTLSGVLERDDDDAEADLLQRLADALADYDQVCVWEGDWKGGEFDSFVVPARMQRTGVDADARRWVWLNQLAVWKKMNMHSAESGAEKESFKLDDIAFEQLRMGKEPTPEWVRERFGERADRGLGALAWDLWEAGGRFRDLLLRYNIRDAELLHKLEQKKGYITLFQATAELCGIPPVTQSLMPTRQMDGYILRLGRRRNHRFPTKVFREDEGERKKFRGAVVFHPKSVPDPGENWTAEDAAAWRRTHGFANGILRNVHVCDFKSLYPSVMRTWNLSGDAVVGKMSAAEFERAGAGEGRCWSPGTGVVTRVEPEGFLPLALRDLMAQRQQYADAAAKLPYGTPEWLDAMSKSTACKVTANSFYGGGGSPGSRYYDVDVSESCTQNGVHFLRLTASEGERRGMVLVYGDTDSNMVIGPTMQGFDRFVRWMNAKRIPEEVARYGCRENYIENAFEKSYDRVVFVRAKAYVASLLHYKWSTTCNRCTKPSGGPGSVDARTLTCRDCGYVYDSMPKNLGEPEIKGVAYKRGDKGKLARELQGKVIDLLVGGLTVKGADGKRRSANEGLRIGADVDGAVVVEDPSAPARVVETPTDDVDVYRAVIRRARDHVLSGPLTLEEVRFSKGINKRLREYAKRGANGKESVPAHVGVARVLESRGEVVGVGSRIEYVVVDGSTTPQRVIPASDYAGECDRYYLWERVYEPSKSLLTAAFPDEDWEQWGDVRPKVSRHKQKVPEGQLGLDLVPASTRVNAADEIALPAFRAAPLIVEVPEDAGEATLSRLRDCFRRNPGARAVEVHIITRAGGRAVQAIDARVSTGPKLMDEVTRVLAGDNAP